MRALFKLFFLIAILNKGPQDVPYSRFLFVALLVISFITDLLLSQVPTTTDRDLDAGKVAIFLVLATFIILGVTYLLIRAHGFANRAVQTLTALLGVELVIKAIQIPVLVLMPLLANNQGVLLLLYYILIMTFGWGLFVNVHIFKHALSTSTLRAAIITLALFSLGLFLNYRFFPGSS